MNENEVPPNPPLVTVTTVSYVDPDPRDLNFGAHEERMLRFVAENGALD